MATIPRAKLDEYQAIFSETRQEIGKAVIGHEEVINALLRALIADGHVLLEGVPGVAKTLMVRTFAAVCKSKFNRIQFTPDLLPTDIIGITAFDKDKGFYVMKGPIFSNFILADEINRAPPKVQSALLECMAERQATIGKEVFALDPPFFVLATQNPLENLGTYPLPEAQVDRFLFKLNVGYPHIDEEQQVLKTNMTTKKFERFNLEASLDKMKIFQMQRDVHKIYVAEKIEKYIVSLVDATRYPKRYNLKNARYIQAGCSPRATIGLYISGKAEALIKGKDFVTPTEIKSVAKDVLRHRIILNYEAQADNISTEEVIEEILQKVPIP
ncbi:MAG: MoxR family ATPase [Candidatus Woesearchaeota archaeon]